ncbi:MAG: hypothetical protein IJH37_01985 [Clostridia bacterium]|nr:hypothetical protein [Clostridia bacterium]
MTMEFTRINGEFTRSRVKSQSECIRDYKGYSIAFGAFERTGNETFWHISIYRNSGNRMELEYRTTNRWACDGQAMAIETKLAKQFIDSLEKTA